MREGKNKGRLKSLITQDDVKDLPVCCLKPILLSFFFPFLNPSHPPSAYHRYIERLKAKNERLTAALERKKGETEQIGIALIKLESDCSALQMALKYWYVRHTLGAPGHVSLCTRVSSRLIKCVLI